MRGVLKKDEKFYLVGYSFGALVALELALLLEKFKYSGNILLIDGAPLFLNELVRQSLGEHFTDDDLYNEIFTSIAKQLSGEAQSPVKVKEEFKNLNTYEKKIMKLIEYGRENKTFSKLYAEKMIKKMFERIKMISGSDKFEENKLLSSITLVRPKDVSIEDIEEDYNLSKITKGKVSVRYVDGNHISILGNSDLIAAINYFDPAKDEKITFENYLYSAYVVESDFV